MNIGISAESASINASSDCTSTAGGSPTVGGTSSSTTSAASSAAAFGQCMAQALQARAQAPGLTGAATSPEDPGLIGLDLGSSDPANAEDDAQAGLSNEALASLGLSWLPGWTGLPPVQQVSVGPSLLAITGAAATPDATSLQAFAREQGLGAEAIAWLMNPHSAAGPTLTATGDTAAAGAGAAQVLAQPSALASDLSALGLPTATGASALAANAPGLDADSAMTTATAWATVGSPAPSPAPAAPAWNGAAATALAATALPMASQALAGGMQGEPAAPDAPAEPEGLATAAAVLGALRWAPAAQASAKSTAPATPTSAWSAQTGPSWSEVTLDLASLWGAQAEAEAEGEIGHPADEPNTADASQPPALAGASALPAKALHGTGLARAETFTPSSLEPDQLQQLSEKMADAVGERMLRELERGHWSMRLMLKPAHLGHIEVEMRLRGGELDATFAAPLAVTRDLLQDGLNRLRESLAQAGMDVANLHVKTGQNRQNGGDSTPGQPKFANNNKGSSAPEAAPASVESRPRPGRLDGWDILV